MRPQSSVGFGENIHKLKNSDKATSHILGEARAMTTLIASKRPEEREFVVDSGASMQVMSKKRIKFRTIMDGENVLNSVDCKR